MSTQPPLQGRIIAITGAARGIGEAAARAVGGDGASVVLIDVDGAALEAVARSLQARVLLARTADLRRPAELEAIAQDLRARGAGVDVVINNAGVYAQGPLLELPAEELERCVRVNTLGAVAACRAFVPLMRGRPGAQIVQVLSEFAWLPFPNKSSYCISKAGAAMASACLRTELRAQGIRVTDFVPPPVDTGLVRQASALRPEQLAREIELIRAHAWPAERVGRRIADAVRRPRDLVVCGWTTRITVMAARQFPALARVLAASAARRMGLS